MIIFDEQLQNPALITAVKQWYPGTVTHIRTLRANSVIKDDNIPALLHVAPRPTFVTINVNDFGRKIQAHPGYCVIAIDLAQGSSLEIQIILRQVINHVAFKSRMLRMGKVIYVRRNLVYYYAQDGQIRQVDSPS